LGHKEINGPIYYSLPIIKCPKSTLQEFQDGIGVVNEGVLSKENILIVVKDKNIMLDSKLNAWLGDFGLTCVENEKISYEELEGLFFLV